MWDSPTSTDVFSSIGSEDVMNVYDILTDAEHAAIDAVMQESVLPPQTTLIVEDDDVARNQLAEILEVNGIQCLMATNAFEAFNLLDTDWSIGLIITDLRIQPAHGLGFIRQIRESVWADLPVVIISGDEEVPNAIAAMHWDVTDFMLKPIDPEKLIRSVSRELGIKGLQWSAPTLC
jgi:DNA-binding NtrC family response regulator